MSWEVRTMRSGTSFFNAALFRKTFLRFWPIWALYTAGWTLVLPLRLWADAMRRSDWAAPALAEYLQNAANGVPGLLEAGVPLAAGAGLVCAMAVFSYLYSSRSACMMHALPLRREALFLTQYLAGLSFLLLPQLAIFILTAATEAALGCLALWPLTQWLLVQSGLCLFFYSFAVFCAMFTGHLAALPVFYGVLNILAFVMTSLTEAECSLFLYGFQSFPSPVWEFADYLSPPIALSRAVSLTYQNEIPSLYQPGLVAVYAAVGAALAIAALLLYRSRHIESAGDVVAVKLVRPLFKYGVALCAGLSGGMFSYQLLSGLSSLTLMGWILFWELVGYFAAEMLLRKSFRVLPAWKGAVPLAAAIVFLSLSVHYDWYGFESRVPDPSQVTRVTVDSLQSAPYDDGRGGLSLEDPEQISLAIQLHRAAIQLKGESAGEEDWTVSSDQETMTFLYLHLYYELADGTVLERNYPALPIVESDRDVEGSLTWAAEQLLSDRENVEQMYNFQHIESDYRLMSAYLVDVWNTQTRQYETVYLDGSTEKLWQAMRQDFAEGTIGVRYLFDNSVERMENTCATDLYFDYEVPPDPEGREPEYSSSFSITLTPQASHTLALLHELKVLDETHLALTNREAEELEREARGAGTSSGCSHAFFLRTAAVRETVSPPRRKDPGPGGPGS